MRGLEILENWAWPRPLIGLKYAYYKLQELYQSNLVGTFTDTVRILAKSHLTSPTPM